MKNCTNCGTSNTEDSKFCFSCGTPLPSQSQPAETTIPVDLAVSDPTAIPTPLIPPTSLPSTQKGIDNATNGISGKHVVAIAAGLLVVATAIGAGGLLCNRYVGWARRAVRVNTTGTSCISPEVR
ncbi:zinc-ribbon domain-containing protein [Bifidobacterium merycicum]|uniref:zinc-ribbon domain-containing protein n=1 Tax=Bifidobacterium merycicum TaxID=78345 RepID=UPI0009DEC7D2